MLRKGVFLFLHCEKTGNMICWITRLFHLTGVKEEAKYDHCFIRSCTDSHCAAQLFGWSRIVSEKIREKPWRKQFQRGMAIPYAILGVGWIILGLIYPDVESQNSTAFWIKLLLIAVIPAGLLVYNKKKFDL